MLLATQLLYLGPPGITSFGAWVNHDIQVQHTDGFPDLHTKKQTPRAKCRTIENHQDVVDPRLSCIGAFKLQCSQESRQAASTIPPIWKPAGTIAGVRSQNLIIAPPVPLILTILNGQARLLFAGTRPTHAHKMVCFHVRHPSMSACNLRFPLIGPLQAASDLSNGPIKGNQQKSWVLHVHPSYDAHLPAEWTSLKLIKLQRLLWSLEARHLETRPVIRVETRPLHHLISKAL